MVKFLFILFHLSLLTIIANGQSEEHYAFLIGDIKNVSTPQVMVQGINESESTTLPMIEGHFEGKINLNRNPFYKLSVSNEYATLYLEPDDTLYLTLDGNAFDETLHFEGTHKGENQYLVDQILLQEELEKSLAQAEFNTFTNGQFNQVSDSLLQLKIQLLNDRKYHVNSTFKRIQTKWLLWDHQLQQYLFTQKEVYNQKDTNSDQNQKNTELSALDSVDMADTDLLHYPKLIHLVQIKLIEQKPHLPESIFSSPSQLYEELTMRAMKLPNGIVKPSIIHPLLRNMIMFGKSNRVKKILDDFIALDPPKNMIQDLQILIDQWAHLEPGQKAPDFKVIDQQGNEISLPDFQGKVVLMDVWATWCMPCLRETPYLDEIQNAFDTTELVILGISIDQKEAIKNWESYISKKNLPGIQARFYEQREPNLVSNYLIQQIPRYIIIDRSGRIYNNHAPRPSNTALLIDELNAALKVKK